MLKVDELARVAAGYCGERPSEIDRRLLHARYAFEIGVAVRDPRNWRFVKRYGGIRGSKSWTHMLRFAPGERLEGSLHSLEISIREEDDKVTGIQLW